jgi:hypothetical protein
MQASKGASLVLSAAPFEAEVDEILLQAQSKEAFRSYPHTKEENIRHFKKFLQVFGQLKFP